MLLIDDNIDTTKCMLCNSNYAHHQIIHPDKTLEFKQHCDDCTKACQRLNQAEQARRAAIFKKRVNEYYSILCDRPCGICGETREIDPFCCNKCSDIMDEYDVALIEYEKREQLAGDVFRS